MKWRLSDDGFVDRPVVPWPVGSLRREGLHISDDERPLVVAPVQPERHLSGSVCSDGGPVGSDKGRRAYTTVSVLVRGRKHADGCSRVNQETLG